MNHRIVKYLEIMLEGGASDLHVSAHHPPHMRIHGDIAPLPGEPVLSSDEIEAMLKEIMSEEIYRKFQSDADADFAYELDADSRFRFNAFRDRFGVGLVCRVIPTKIPTADQLGLPPVLRELASLSRGLVVVTGPTGSGKSTTLASIIDLINATRKDHIITIEDPIEFVHTSQGCLVNQREVHRHTQSFPTALRAALREDPDIVLVGEMRDLETIETAIETAETGHLVFGTLHTNTAPSTVNRIIDKFPADRQNQIRTMLSASLRAVVAQTLCKTKDGKGRVAAFEVLVSTTAISAYIRENKTHQIASAMQTGRSLGMTTFTDSLFELVKANRITPDEAYLRAIDKASLRKLLEDGNYPGFQPGDIQKNMTRLSAMQHQALKRQQEAIRVNREILERDPNDITALNALAWTLSVSRTDELRDGKAALTLAERAYKLTRGQDLAVLDTLAAAYAENGRFDKAAGVLNEAFKIARTTQSKSVASAIERQIELYRQHKPQRET